MHKTSEKNACMINRVKKTLPILLSPFILAIIPTVVIILLVPMNRDRYLLELVDHKLAPINYYTFFEDLNNDGYSEEIHLFSTESHTSLKIFHHTGQVYDQWNLHGSFAFWKYNSLYVAGDYNGNGFRELFVFTISNDSIFMHGLFDLYSDTLHIKNRFIAHTGPGNLRPDPFIIEADMEDLNGDGNRELIFGIGAGFSLYPRNIFAYYIDADSLVRSPYSGYGIRGIVQADLNGNGKREMIVMGNAPGNIHSDTVVYHDHHNWLMVFDQHLEFLFEPKAFPEHYVILKPFAVNKDHGTYLACIITSYRGFMPALYYRFDSSGRVIERKEIPGNVIFSASSGMPLSWEKSKGMVFALISTTFDLSVYDTQMNLVRFLPSYGFQFFRAFDLDGDGQQEIVGFNTSLGKIHVFREGFRFPVSASFEPRDNSEAIFCIIQRGQDHPRLFFQHTQNQHIFDYGPNPNYYLNYGIYLLIYAGMLGFTHFSRRIQRRQLLKQQETEKRIAELQINLVKNKLDPHFSINALNSIIQAIRDDRKEVAEDGLLQFVSIYRSMLVSADKIDHGLDEEMAFTKSYLNIERLRYDKAFDYCIEVSHGVDHATLVPKMIMQIHAENAVKHGLSSVGSGGKLHIAISQSEEGLQIVITDNGIGFTKGKEAAQNKRSQGLVMMQELYGLYRITTGTEVVSQIQDVINERGEIAGTEVQITITQTI